MILLYFIVKRKRFCCVKKVSLKNKEVRHILVRVSRINTVANNIVKVEFTDRVNRKKTEQHIL